MSSLRSTLTDLAQTFAANVLEAIRQMSLDEILAETQGGGAVGGGRGGPRARVALEVGAAGRTGRKKAVGGGRLSRRSADDIAAIVDDIVGLLEKHSEGLRAEQIRAQLGLEAKELPRPLADALAAKRISKKGQKRATTYFAGGGRPAKAEGGAKAKRAAKKTSRGAKAGAKKRGAAHANGAATA